jgi:hypothetical protein
MSKKLLSNDRANRHLSVNQHTVEKLGNRCEEVPAVARSFYRECSSKFGFLLELTAVGRRSGKRNWPSNGMDT